MKRLHLKLYSKGEHGPWGGLVAALSEMGPREEFTWWWKDMIKKILAYLFGNFLGWVVWDVYLSYTCYSIEVDVCMLATIPQREAECSINLIQVAFILG